MASDDTTSRPPPEGADGGDEEKHQEGTLLEASSADQIVISGGPQANGLAEDRARGSGAIPLISASSWDELHLSAPILKGVYAKGFVKPSFIQARALPIILSPAAPDLIAQARNGSGKTATFSLAMLVRVDESLDATQALCLCNTRELAVQNLAVVTELGRFLERMRFYAAVAQNSVKYDTHSPAHIVVGTPGRVSDMLKKRFLNVARLKVFILDEADVMMDGVSNLSAQIATIQKFLPQKRIAGGDGLQTLLFSATFAAPVRSYCESQMPDAIKVELKEHQLTLPAVSQYYYPVLGVSAEADEVAKCSTDVIDELEAKTRALMDLYASCAVGQSVVFVNRKETALTLARKLNAAGNAVSVLVSQRNFNEAIFDREKAREDVELREKVLSEFRRGETTVLIASDVMARGIDVPQVTLVVNFDLPVCRSTGETDYETYLHRIGRTGRFGSRGIAISFVAGDAEEEKIQKIRSFFQCSVNRLPDDFEEVEKMVRELRSSAARPSNSVSEKKIDAATLDGKNH